MSLRCSANRAALLAALTIVGASGASSANAQNKVHVVRAAAWITPAGEVQKDALIVIDGERIAAVNADAPKDAPVAEFERAVVCPGLIDCHAAISALGNLGETAAPLEPQARARDAFDRFHPHVTAALQSGVTTFALCPDDGNVIGGRVAICQTYGPDRAPRVLSDAGPLKLSISPAAFLPDREPTSRSGAMGMLRTTLASAKAGASGNAKPAAESALAELSSGKLAALAAAPSGADVLSLLGLADEFGLKLTLIHSQDARDIAAEAARAKVGVIVGPLDFSSSPRIATAPAVLDEKGVKLALAGGLPTAAADSLRIGAAVAARNGLSLAAARRAITSVPAEFLGIADRLGRIEKGLRADLVVFSGDPLDLRSRVLAVYVGGVRVPVAELAADSK